MTTRQARLPGTASRRRQGTAELALERNLRRARRDGLVTDEHAGLVGQARVLARALDGAARDGADRTVADLARELRMTYRDLALTVPATQGRAASTADALGELLAGLGAPE